MSRNKEWLRSDSFEIKSVDSSTKVEVINFKSYDSELENDEEISDKITGLLHGEKQKFQISKKVDSKTDSQMEKKSLLGSKKYYSTSTLYALKPTLILPIHIFRIFNSNKRYPNVPQLQKNQDVLNAIYGAFFGFLVGDIAGAHLAYKTQRMDIYLPSALLMNGGGTYNIGAGQGSDQTEILFSVCYGLIEGKGIYNQNLIAKKYLDWIESKPFNFSTLIALALRELRKLKDNGALDEKKMGKILRQSSQRNLKFQSSLGFIRILPLTIFGLKFSDHQFEKLIKEELCLVCPNQLVIESGIVYGKMLRIIILTRDHERAFFEGSKWIYDKGSDKLKDLWNIVERGIEIPSPGNMGRLKTAFTYACIEMSKKDINFFEILCYNLQRGGDTDANCAIVMTLIGAIVGYNGIPGYFKQKIINARMKDSPRPRDQKYSPHQVVGIIENLMKVQPNRLFNLC